MSNIQDAINILEQLRDQPRNDAAEAAIWKERFEWLADLLKREHINAKFQIEQLKEQGLSFNSLEAEGFLRGILEANDLVKMVLDQINYAPADSDDL